jgi:hypothetical protein
LGAIGRELIRRSRERIIEMERNLDWMRIQGGYADNIAETERDLAQERAALEADALG